MSIVACVMFKDEGILIGSDKRAIKDGLIDENYKKLYEIKEGLIFGMTGIAEEGHFVLAHLMKNSDLPTLEIVNMADAIFKPKDTAIILAGKDENNQFFMWHKNSEKVSLTRNESEMVHFLVSSNNNVGLYTNYLGDQLEKVEIDQAILNTIYFASKNDETINNIADLYCIRK
jgi:hypothetical protein